MTTKATKRPRAGLKDRQEWITAYLFILPATLVIGIFGLFPILYSVYMSVYTWRIRQGAFIGLKNYVTTIGNWGAAAAFFGGLLLIIASHWVWTSAFSKMEAKRTIPRLLGALVLLAAGVSISLGWNAMMADGDGRFLNGLIRTVYYGFGSVPIQIILALIIAFLLFQNIRGQEFFRMLYFLPYVTPAVAGGAVFRNLFSPRAERPMNTVLSWFGIEPQRWLQEPKPVMELMFGELFQKWGIELSGFWAGPSLALITVIVFGIWTYTGYNAVIFLAGLGNIPKDLYEAAEIDGANKMHQFFNITVPLLSPVTFYLTVLGFIGTFQAFTHLYVMRMPASRDAMDTASIVIFDTFYKRNNFSLAAAQSVILFVIILILTLLQNRLFGKRALGEQ